jgi:hypothetical protein
MSIVNAVAGQSVNASTRFTDEEGVPIGNIALPVTYKIFDPQMRLVLTDNAVQDSIDASLFTATFTLPASLPPSQNGQDYRIQWLMKTTYGTTARNTENFAVGSSGDDPDSFYPKDVLIVPGAGFIDRVKLNNVGTLPTVVYNIIDEAGRVLYRQTISPDTSSGRFAVYTAEFTPSAADGLGVPTGVQQHYIGNWFMTGGDLQQPEVESHPIYVLTPALQTIILAVYKLMSDGILVNVDPYLTWTAGQFAHHAIKGFEYVNSAGIRITGFTINSPLPSGLTQYIEKAAMVSAMRAQLFAYSSDWDFQGSGVQLNVNRSSTLTDMISQLQSDLDKLPDAKKAWLNSGQPTGSAISGKTSPTPMSATALSIGPSTNYAAKGVPFEAIMPSFLTVSNFAGPRGGRRL